MQCRNRGNKSLTIILVQRRPPGIVAVGQAPTGHLELVGEHELVLAIVAVGVGLGCVVLPVGVRVYPARSARYPADGIGEGCQPQTLRQRILDHRLYTLAYIVSWLLPVVDVASSTWQPAASAQVTGRKLELS